MAVRGLTSRLCRDYPLHHISAQKELENLDMCGKGEMIFDMSRCGAQIAWDYVYPKVDRPWLVEYVADRDLWLNKLIHTKEVSQYLNFYEIFSDFAALTSLSTSKAGDKVFTDIVTEGTILLKIENKKIDYYVKTSSIMNFTCDTKVYKVRVADSLDTVETSIRVRPLTARSEIWSMAWHASRGNIVRMLEIKCA
jgi:hypothetical protein